MTSQCLLLSLNPVSTPLPTLCFSTMIHCFRRSTRTCLSKRSTLDSLLDLGSLLHLFILVRRQYLSFPQIFNGMFSNLPPHAASDPSASYNLVLMDHTISPQDLSLFLDCLTASHLDLQEHCLMGSAASSLTPPMDFPNSGPSLTYSGSLAWSDLSLPVIAPRPVPAGNV